VQLAPAGYHGMMMDLTRDLYPGEAEKLVLTFADSSGTTFEIPVGALVTDLPPEESTARVVNVVAVQADDGALELALTIDNNSDIEDKLISVSEPLSGTELLAEAQTSFAPSIILMPRQETRLTSEQEFIRLTDTSEPLPNAFPIILIFASGKFMTVGVAVVAGAAS
jgi:copper(I)-binding protein